MFEIVNRQRKIRIPVAAFKKFAEKIIENVSEINGKTVAVAFVSDRRMTELNKTFRGKNATTDVLSFPFEADEFETGENSLGDIIISAEQAERQARENNLDLETEIKQLVLHGVLHLCGYDHEADDGEMNELELQIREKLGI